MNLPDKATVGEILGKVRAQGRDALNAPENKQICEAYGIATPREGLATTAEDAAKLAALIRRNRQPGTAGRDRRDRSAVRDPHAGAQHLRLLLHAAQPVRDLPRRWYSPN
jgi:hypothetical protein